MASRNPFQSLCYQSGRLLGYLLLGLVAGLMGEALGILHPLFQSGGLSLVSGLLLLGFLFFPRLSRNPWIPPLITSLIARMQSILLLKLREKPNQTGIVLGFFTILLPCGLLYAALMLSASQPTVWQAATGMGAFFLGTLPALIAAQLSSAGIKATISPRWVQAFWALSLLILAVILILRGLALLGVVFHQNTPDAICW